MKKYLVIPILLISFLANAQLSLSQLKDRGSAAYSNDDCIRAVKYLYAYQIMSDDLSQKERQSLDSAINYCEQKLGRYVTMQSVTSGLTANRGVIVNADGEIQTFDVTSGGVLITSDGGLKTLDPEGGGVFVSSLGVMEPINNKTGGLLISSDGTLSHTPKDIEYLIKGMDFKVNDEQDLDFILNKKKIELENLERYQSLMQNGSIKMGAPE